ncbi:hypothetical protein H311_00156 [Anncaliia algerae PRA109]|nr:hypothetical protein H311_00156 [Anncaliia algerae PRA109]
MLIMKSKNWRPWFHSSGLRNYINFKCKSPRGRSLNNKTDALCIIEFKNKITRCFAFVINNKEAKTIISIIFSQILPA